ncbi:hypothetical protein BJ165DRAFT_571677 [Panaeolus papilionaceus]|nr:hypothetical protein BJ165DRAFT_571677 [Panaeolus papilionaceus]
MILLPMPSPRLVFLDNTASDIQYGPSWTQQTSTSSAVHLGTLQTTNTNTSFTFKFSGEIFRHIGDLHILRCRLYAVGTAINAVGSIHIKKVNGVQDPRWECFVDQKPVKNGAVGDGFIEDAWLLCSAHDLSDTDHTFTLNTISQGSNFYFDSLSYQPSSNVDISEKVVRINNDDEAVKYTGKFGVLGDFANMTSESGASVSVDFIGKSLSWYGFIPKELPHEPTTATYNIDGGSPHMFRLGGLPDAKSSSRRNQVFFTTPDLQPGPHTIVVTHEGNTSTTPLVLDYLLVANATVPTNGVAHKRVPVGPIVGGVIGGLVLIGLLCYIVYFYTRRKELAKRWRRQTMRGVDASFRDPEIDTPYVPPSKSMSQPLSSPLYHLTRTTLPNPRPRWLRILLIKTSYF